MKRPAFLESDRIRFSPLDLSDIDIYMDWFNQPEMRRLLIQPYPISREKEREFLEGMMSSEDSVTLSIIEKESEALIGNISLHNINRIDRSAVLGIAIITGYQDRGYGTEALKLMIRYGFDTLNLNRIGLCVHDFNERAIRSYEKAGFKEEGRRRKSHFTDGKYHDEILMSILVDEWRS